LVFLAQGALIAIVKINLEQTHFFHADYLGSVRLVTDVTGAVVWSERYRKICGVKPHFLTFYGKICGVKPHFLTFYVFIPTAILIAF